MPIFRTLGISFMLMCSAMSYAQETISIATGEYPPWTSAELNGDGLINLIVKEAFKTQNIEVEFHYMPWKRAMEATRVGKHHASSFWAYDHKREEHFIHSHPIRPIPFVFFYRKDNPIIDWKSLKDLTGYRIGATRGYTYTTEFWDLANNHTLRVSTENDDLENLRKLIEGKIDLFPIDDFTGWFLLGKHFSPEQKSALEVHDKGLSHGNSFLLFSRNIDDNLRLSETFNKGLEKLKTDGRMEALEREILDSCCR